MAGEKLRAALESVDWNHNIKWLCLKADLAGRVEDCNGRLAIWAGQLESTERGVSSLCFIREMQHAGHHAACATALALYKPAAASMRTLVECALYHVYFRSHKVELATLVREDKYYVSKKEIIDYMSLHIRGFKVRQEKVNLIGRLNAWYSKTSAIVHGQLPGTWSIAGGVSKLQHVEKTVTEVVECFEHATNLVQDLFLCAITQDVWPGFASKAKKVILKGIPGDVRAVLELDTA